MFQWEPGRWTHTPLLFSCTCNCLLSSPSMLAPPLVCSHVCNAVGGRIQVWFFKSTSNCPKPARKTNLYWTQCWTMFPALPVPKASSGTASSLNNKSTLYNEPCRRSNVVMETVTSPSDPEGSRVVLIPSWLSQLGWSLTDTEEQAGRPFHLCQSDKVINICSSYQTNIWACDHVTQTTANPQQGHFLTILKA